MGTPNTTNVNVRASAITEPFPEYNMQGELIGLTSLAERWERDGIEYDTAAPAPTDGYSIPALTYMGFVAVTLHPADKAPQA